MAKSYFAILGVASNASPDEIRSAYRHLAKEYHPDHFTGGNRPFLEIQEAYSVLGDAGKRRRYEKSLLNASKKIAVSQSSSVEPEPLIPKQRPVDLGEISPIRSFQTLTPSVDEILDWLWSNFSNLDWPKSNRIQTLTMEIPVTKEQAMRGGSARIMVPVQAICPICSGQGGIGIYQCARCAGGGTISEEIPALISFPPGIKNKHAVIISLENYGIKNLHLTILFQVLEDRF